MRHPSFPSHAREVNTVLPVVSFENQFCTQAFAALRAALLARIPPLGAKKTATPETPLEKPVVPATRTEQAIDETWHHRFRSAAKFVMTPTELRAYIKSVAARTTRIIACLRKRTRF